MANNEQRYFDALKRIAADYMSVEQLKRTSEEKYGLDAREAVEYAYENVIEEARAAIRGRRRPQARFLRLHSNSRGSASASRMSRDSW